MKTWQTISSVQVFPQVDIKTKRHMNRVFAKRFNISVKIYCLDSNTVWMKTREKAYKPAVLQIDPERSHKNIMFQQIQRLSKDQRPILTLAKNAELEYET